MLISHLDHLVLTVRDIDKTKDFYCSVLGMEAETFAQGRQALKFGNQKINLHELGSEFSPRAQIATPGSADLCFISEISLSEITAGLIERGIDIIEGPVKRTGATGSIESIYLRDPDSNLIEIANYL
jgi:catechol 2,3-dioxygenase-like lactoylglutathione lyase family enzyme